MECGLCGFTAVTHASGPMKLCGRCRRVIYCSRSCQRLHWSAHKNDCVLAEWCPVCKERFAIKCCAGCRNVRYCSRACQKIHWSEHRSECLRVQRWDIEVSLISGKTVHVACDPMWTVLKMTKQVSKLIGVPWYHLELTLGGIILKQRITLEATGLGHRSHMQVVVTEVPVLVPSSSDSES